MKKIIALILTLVLSVSFGALLTACNKDSDTSDKAAGNKLKVFAEYDLTAESYAFAVKKGNSAMLASANELLAELKANGQLDAIINSFFDGTADFAYENTVATVPTDKDKYLVVATNAYFPPFEYYDGSKLTGVDIKIAKLLADKLGKTLYVLDEDFDAVIPSVTTGQADIAMAGLTVSESRKEIVDFTTEYYESAQVLIVLESDTTFDGCKSGDDIIALLEKQEKSFTVGAQVATTGYMFTAGDEDFGYDGFANLTAKSYSNGALAALDLSNKKINAVIIDKQPAIMIVKSINGNG